MYIYIIYTHTHTYIYTVGINLIVPTLPYLLACAAGNVDLEHLPRLDAEPRHELQYLFILLLAPRDLGIGQHISNTLATH